MNPLALLTVIFSCTVIVRINCQEFFTYNNDCSESLFHQQSNVWNEYSKILCDEIYKVCISSSDNYAKETAKNSDSSVPVIVIIYEANNTSDYKSMTCQNLTNDFNIYKSIHKQMLSMFTKKFELLYVYYNYGMAKTVTCDTQGTKLRHHFYYLYK